MSLEATPEQQAAFKEAVDSQRSQKVQPRALLVCAADVKPERVHWLWPDWLAAGKLHVLAGAPGTGKTTIALDFAAIVSSGGKWPDGTASEVGDVVIWSSEDGFADTIVPRLMAAGADLSRIHFIQGVRDGTEVRAFDPAFDMPALRGELAKLRAPRLLIVDPIVSAVAGDGNRSNDVRRALQPLVDLAAEFGCAVIGITHHSKGTANRDPIERVTGSIAYGALARLVFATAKMPDDEDGRIFTRAKSNLGPDGGGWRYRLAQVDVLADDSVRASRVAWGEAVEGSARDLLAEAETVAEDTVEERRETGDWLHDVLAAGPVAAKEVEALAELAGFKWRTVQRAKKKAGVISERVGFGPGAKQFWRFKDANTSPCMPYVPLSENGKHGNNGKDEAVPTAERGGVLMGTSDLLGRLALAGVKLSADGAHLIAEPRTALTDELRALIRDHKPELLAALSPIERGRELRRQRAFAELAKHPDKQRWAIFDNDADREFVVCTVAIRNVGSCELRIPRDRYDPWVVLEVLERTQ